MNWIPLFVLVGGVLLYLWLFSGSLMSRRADYKEYVRVYREHLEQSKQAVELARESNRLRSEEMAVQRELIAELRASRQAPGQPLTSPADSN